MACYQCGGPDGSDVQLCPRCRDMRLEEDLSIQTKIRKEYGLNWRTVRTILLEDLRRVSVLVGAVLICFIYYLGLSEYGPELFVPVSKRLSRACYRETALLAAAAQEGKVFPSDHPFQPAGVWGRALVEHFGDSLGSTLLGSLSAGQQDVCKDVFNECDAPGGEQFCSRLLESLRAYRS